MISNKIFLTLAVFATTPALAASITQTNLVSDGAVSAANTDPNLKNPWGISYAPGGAFWVSDNATGLTTLYNGTGVPQSLVVTIPAAGGGTGLGSPTGQVYNPSTTDFSVTLAGVSGVAAFLFATEDGTISGWAPSVSFSTAVVAVDRSTVGLGAVYKGLAYYTNSSGANYLLATDFRNNEIDEFDASFTLVKSFRDSMMPANYAPYNIAVMGGKIYVTYAKQDKMKHDSVSGKGLGAVETIDFNGKVKDRYMGGDLNAPWGLALAPAGWGKLSNHLLVGNFGDGHITTFHGKLKEGAQLMASGGTPIAIDGLWGLIPGNGGTGGATNTIYFAAGTNYEQDGLFGSLTYAP
jgi:uncharacterized protein (TIGR03118 family)